MQVDVGSEENDNVEEVQYIVENTSLVSIEIHIVWVFQRKTVSIFLPISFDICFGYSKEPSH